MTRLVSTLERLVPHLWHPPCTRCRLPCGATARRTTTLERWVFLVFILSSVFSLILVLVQTAATTKYKIAKDSSVSPDVGGSGHAPTAVDQKRLLRVYAHHYDSSQDDEGPERKKQLQVVAEQGREADESQVESKGEVTENYDHALPSQLPSDDMHEIGALLPTEPRSTSAVEAPAAGPSSVLAKDSVSEKKKKDQEATTRRNIVRRKKVDYSLLSLGVLKFSKSLENQPGRKPAENKRVLQDLRRRRPGVFTRPWGPQQDGGGSQTHLGSTTPHQKQTGGPNNSGGSGGARAGPGILTRWKRANSSVPWGNLPPILLELDYNRPSYFPWRSTEDGCRNFATRSLVPGSGPRLPLASFPGGGNTWLRYLVEAATGVFTGSIYHDEALALKGMWGERDGYRLGTTLLQKTHSRPLMHSDLNSTHGVPWDQELWFLLAETWPRRAILLLRNPFECMLALRHYHVAGHTGFASRDAFLGPEWKNFTLERALAWRSLAESWLTLRNVSLLVIHFEHLKSNLEREMQRLIAFLGIPIDYSRLDCLLRYPEGRFHRPRYHRHLQGYNFPKEAINIVQDALHYIDTLLRSQGHPPLPLDLYTYVPEPIVTPPAQQDTE